MYKNDSLFYKIYIALISLSFFFFLVILAWPYTTYSEEKVEKNGIDIQILFDVSYSMTATDLEPNRLEVAKKVFSDFVDTLTSDRVWMVVFAGRPYVSFPLTFDYIFIKDFLSKITSDTINQNVYWLQWTAIWDAMILWESSFHSDEKRQKIMILLTDWEANRWINPLTAIKYIKEKWIKVYTIGVGWDQKTYVSSTDMFWNPQKLEVWWIDEETLKEIAWQTWGKYYRATSPEALSKIVQEIGSLEKTKIEEKKIVFEKSLVFPFVLILCFLMCWVMFLFIRKVKI